MGQQKTFAELLDEHMQTMGLGNDRLAEATNIPKPTIVGWRTRGKHPRLWKDVLNVAVVLGLDYVQADQLLKAAGHPPLERLMRSSLAKDESANEMLARWPELSCLQDVAGTPPTISEVDGSKTRQPIELEAPAVPHPTKHRDVKVLGALVGLCMLLLVRFIAIQRMSGLLGDKNLGRSWTRPPRNFITQRGCRGYAAYAHAEPRWSGIAKVNVTVEKGGWRTACTGTSPNPGTDASACDEDSSGLPLGPFRVSFDVYDMAGHYGR
jgi:hypothetical protein